MGKSPTLIIGTIFIVLATILNFIAFVSPYWLVSDPRANNPFKRIGLWEACLEGFVDPKDYVSKLYDGCWWIFWPEFIEIRYWLNPPWFTALQVLAVFNFLIIVFGMMTVTGIMCHCCSSDSNRTVFRAFVLVFVSFIFSTIEAILFGMGSIDRTWMPKADFNILSWGYWLHVLGGFFTFISAVALFCNWFRRRFDESEKDSTSGQSHSGSY
ncbi:pck [Bugula neritina]|uniref:Pck n=1 Tax=Bugula neritina TaxID=10212 RepID=A0A7J7J5S8_BUGNE|nr:pck [Bugula neritina]